MNLTPNIKYNVSLSSKGVNLKSKFDILSDKPLIGTTSVFNWRLYNDKVFYGNLTLRIQKLYDKLINKETNYDDFELSYIVNLNEYPEVINPLPQDYKNPDTILDVTLLNSWYDLAITIAQEYDNSNNYRVINNLPLFLRTQEDLDVIKLYDIFGNYLDEKRSYILFQNYFNSKNTYDQELNNINIINNIIRSKGININHIINEEDYDKLIGNFKYDKKTLNHYEFNESDDIEGMPSIPDSVVNSNIQDFIDSHPGNENILPDNVNYFGYNKKRVMNLSGSKFPFKSYPVNNSEINHKKRILGDLNVIMKSKGLSSAYNTIMNIIGLSNYKIYNYKNTPENIENSYLENTYYAKIDYNHHNKFRIDIGSGPFGPDIELITFNSFIDSTLKDSSNPSDAPFNLGSKYILYRNEKFHTSEILSSYNTKTDYSNGMKYMREGNSFIIINNLETPYTRQQIPLEQKNCVNKRLYNIIIPTQAIIILDDIIYITDEMPSSSSSTPFHFIDYNMGMLKYVGINNINMYFNNLEDKKTIPLGYDNLKNSFMINDENIYIYNILEYKQFNLYKNDFIPEFSQKKYSDNNIEGGSAQRLDIGYNIGRELDKYLYDKLFREELSKKVIIPKGSLYFDNKLDNYVRTIAYNTYGKKININDIVKENKFTNINYLFNIIKPLSTTLMAGTIIESNSLTENINGTYSDGVINRPVDEDILRKNYIFNEDETINNTTLNIYDKDDDDKELILN